MSVLRGGWLCLWTLDLKKSCPFSVILTVTRHPYENLSHRQCRLGCFVFIMCWIYAKPPCMIFGLPLDVSEMWKLISSENKTKLFNIAVRETARISGDFSDLEKRQRHCNEIIYYRIKIWFWVHKVMTLPWLCKLVVLNMTPVSRDIFALAVHFKFQSFVHRQTEYWDVFLSFLYKWPRCSNCGLPRRLFRMV